jgi:hypothetical protein
MERGALVLVLALMLPLGLYGIPYAYAAGTQSTYLVRADVTVGPVSETVTIVKCLNPSDFTLHFEAPPLNTGDTISATWVNSGGGTPSTGDIPNGWRFLTDNPDHFSTIDFPVFIACQSPIAVAGIGVPEFGSLYVAIALGAVVYFMLSRRFARRPTILAEAKA